MKFDPKTPNIGTVDRAIRAIAGTLLIAWAVAGGPVWAWIGLVPLATAVIRFCPAYALVGVRTCPAPTPTQGTTPAATPKM